MIIWTGAGVLVPAILFLTAYMVDDYRMEANQQTAVALYVTAAAALVLGLFFRKRSDRIAMENNGIMPNYTSGEQVVHRIFGNWIVRPTFFFIPMHFWGPIALGLGIYMDFYF